MRELEIEFRTLFELLEPKMWQMANEDKECDVDEIIQESKKQYDSFVAKSKTVKILTDRIRTFFESAIGLKVVKLMEPQLEKSEGDDSSDALPVMVDKPKE